MTGKPLGPCVPIGDLYPCADASRWVNVVDRMGWRVLERSFYFTIYERLAWTGSPVALIECLSSTPLGEPLDLNDEWPITLPAESRWRSHTWGWTHHQLAVLLQMTGRPLRNAVEQDSQ